MRVLVIGGAGLLGWWLVREFSGMGFRLYATYHLSKPYSFRGVEWIRMNLSDPESVLNVFELSRPDVVIHTAAYTDVDGCETNRRYAYSVNYLGSLAVSRIASRYKTYVIYVSTDYVFDGGKGLYSEEDIPLPINFYGLTKLLGEVAVSSVLSHSSLVVRVSGLYGFSPTGKRNFGLQSLESLLKGSKVRAFSDQFLSPTYVPWLANSIYRIVDSGEEISGLLHLAGERLSRFNFARIMASVLGVRHDLVEPVSMSSVQLVARRPRDSSLRTDLAVSKGFSHPSTKDAILDFVRVYRELSGFKSRP